MDEIKQVKLDDILKLLENGTNCVVYGANNSGKTTLLKNINESYNRNNADLYFSRRESDMFPCVMIPAKRVFELQDGGVRPNDEKLNIDVIDRFGKEWTTGSYILGVREKIKNLPIRKKVESMCLSILGLSDIDIFDTSCSDGVQNIVNILCYVFHVLNLYSNTDDISSLVKTRFLLIIDEVELFLYTKSIVNFLDVLFKTFKNINLIISSHSILVMQRIKDFAVLKVENLDFINDYGLSPYFSDFGSILTSLFNINEYPEELDQFILHLDSALKSENCDETRLEPIFKEADNLRKELPNFAELITNLQNNFYKRFNKKCTVSKNV